MEKVVKHKTVLDSDQMRLGEIYARALLAVGQKTGSLEPLLDQIRSFAEAVGQLPKFRWAMESPRLSAVDKSRLIDQALGGKATPEFKNFVKLLARKQRFDCLSAVSAAAAKLYNEYRGRVSATLTTAEPISEDNRNYTAERLSRQLGKEVELVCRVDPSIIAGSVVRVGDTVYDGSTRTQLQRARGAALQRAFQEIRDSFSRFAKES